MSVLAEDTLPAADPEATVCAGAPASGFPDTLTLRAGLALHHARLGAQQAGTEEPTDSEAGVLFAGHDACHVVFDCGSDLRHETRVDVWTLAATSMGLRRYVRYLRHPAVAELFASISWTEALALSPALLADTIRILWRSRSARRWRFDDWELHADQTLGEIRRVHGIRTL